MLKKEQLKDQRIVAFLAKPPVEPGATGFETNATSFRDEAGDLIISNEMTAAFSPFTGKEMTMLASETVASLDDSDFTGKGDLVKACTCSNKKCGVDLFTSKEIATLATGEEFHCVVCATVNKIEAPVEEAAAAEAPVVETPAATEEKPATETVAEAAPAADAPVVPPVETPAVTEEVPAEAAATEVADSGDDDGSDDSDDLSDDDIDQIIDDSAGDDDYNDDDSVAVDDTADGDTYDESDAAVEGDEQITEVATLGDDLIVDLTERADVLPHTIQLAAMTVDHSRLAMFAYNNASGKVECVAYLNRDAAAEHVQPLFAAEKMRTLRDLLVASAEDADSLDSVGLEPITATISVDAEVIAAIEAARSEVSEENASANTDFSETFMSCMNIAMAGMNKGAYANPLLEELTASYEALGIGNAASLAVKVIEVAGNQYALAALERVEELLTFSEETRQVLAKTIDNKVKGLSDTLPINAKRNESMVATAAFDIPSTHIEGVAEKRDIKPLFQNIGVRSIG